MIRLDEAALICDFAETYQIYNWRSLPVRLAATLAAGLRDDSRIKMKMRGVMAAQNTLLLAMITDYIGNYLYSRAGYKDRPKSILAMYIDDQDDEEDANEVTNNVRTFANLDDFMQERSKYINGEN